jgi:hypothetical protein
MRRLIIIAAVLSLSTAPGLAQSQDPGAAPAPSPPAQPGTEASIHGYGDRDKTCVSWTDTCRHCERGDDDAIFCSNIGIACLPAAITCTRRSEPAKDQPVAK